MKDMIRSISTLVLVLVVAWGVWMWGFCRFYVEPDSMAVITAKVGKDLPPGQILAGKGQKGVREEVLGEGRHFLNPILYEHEIRSVVRIPPGQVGLVTSKIGEELPQGEFIAARNQKGIWRGVLGPGKYRFNPYGYQIDILDAISIPVGYAGVVTSLSGEQAPEGKFAKLNQKGVREDILQPGLYYVNPKEFKVDVLEIGVNQVSLVGKMGGEVITKGKIEMQNVAMEKLQTKVLEKQQQKRSDYLSQMAGSVRARLAPQAQQEAAYGAARIPQQQIADSTAMMGLMEYVEFPSRDGFQISLDMTVEVELLPEDIAFIYSRYGDLPAVVDKIILPQITSISRNKGSEYGAKEFIVGEGRQKFQDDLTAALAKTLKAKNLIVHNALIRHVEVPMQILEPIQLASIAVQQDLTNKEKQNTAKKQAELNTELTLIEQRREQVARETEKIKAEIKADQQKQVATIRAEASKSVAEIDKQTALVRADIVRKIGTAEAEAIKMVDGEKAKGLQLKAKACGDPVAFTMLNMAASLNPDVKINILHSGEGTLWTDLEKATLGDLGGAKIIKPEK
ncbi:MAG TPA: SPFH domain-containing protein [Kiritimatiellia bacterium]|nr:SPFH domain-containing protein [Kiritimatiellia bacterium]HQQ04175.1 SPFH domain-containing protein [Kiritimatiellia bacterium]